MDVLTYGNKHSFERSGLSTSRKVVSSVFLEDCALELSEVILPSFPFSILIASCIANIISCIFGLEEPC
ncbi:hypothetical protein Hanom_Chr17g01537061 [Helianthus anomalus]